jgi:hypothetical protein
VIDSDVEKFFTGARRNIRNKREFVTYYDRIFDDEFRELVMKTEVNQLWARWTGVAIPRGEIWFAGFGRAKDDGTKSIKIIAINGPIRSSDPPN